MNKSFNFTKATLASLPVPSIGKRASYQDAKTRGLMFTITDKGTRSYVYYRKILGKPHKILLGRFNDISIEQARNKSAELNAAVATGWNPRETREKDRQELTLSVLFKQFIERHARANVKFSGQYERQFDRYFRSNKYRGLNLADTKVVNIVRADIAQIFGNVTANSQPVTANRILSMISSVFNWGVRSGIIEKNPAAGIQKNGERQYQRDRFLTHEEMPFFFQSVAAHPIEIMRDYVLLSLLTGQRQANVLAMAWQEIDYKQSLWRIPKEKTKTSREYLVPLTPEAMEIIERRKLTSTSLFVLEGTGASGHFNNPSVGWQRILIRAEAFGLIEAISSLENLDSTRIALEKLDLEYAMESKLANFKTRAAKLNIDPDSFSLGDLRMHDLRRTLASWQASTGANLVCISKTLNHANVSTTSIYARLQTDPVRKAIQVATDAIFVAAGFKQDSGNQNTQNS